MKLFATPASPYARKARVVILEHRIPCEIVMLESLTDPDSPLLEYNPLGKVPTLVLDDGSSLYDSKLIVSHLDYIGYHVKLFSGDYAQILQIRRWEMLADGLCDAVVAIVLEHRREAAQQSMAWIARQQTKIDRALQTMAHDLGYSDWCVGRSFSMADVAVVCALGYLGWRQPETLWQTRYPNLNAWYGKQLARASLAETQPTAT